MYLDSQRQNRNGTCAMRIRSQSAFDTRISFTTWLDVTTRQSVCCFDAQLQTLTPFVSRNFKFSDVHVTGAARIARIAKESGVTRFVQVSHLNASPDSTSQFYRTKAEGEEAVKEIFPTATIVRPSAIYGYEDRFLKNMAGKPLNLRHALLHACILTPRIVWPIWWKLNHMQTRVRPVHVSRLIILVTIPLTSTGHGCRPSSVQS